MVHKIVFRFDGSFLQRRNRQGEGRTGGRDIQALGREENGIDADLERISGTAGAQEVELDLEVGIGSIRVELED